MLDRWRDRSARPWVACGAVLVVALSVRGPITAVAPIIGDIQRELGITEASAGLLTSAPVVCFALMSPVVTALARRAGVDAAIAWSLVVLAVAVVMRPWAGFVPMLICTVFIGTAIAICNVLLPAVARRDFPRRAGTVLSATTTAMIVSAAIPAATMVPLASWLGWQSALAIWALMVVIALALWLVATTLRARARSHLPASALPVDTPARSVWRSPAAWELGVFFGLQAVLFYTATAWLPTLLQEDAGFDAATAGTAMSAFQLFGIGGTLAMSLLMNRWSVRVGAVTVMAALWVVLFGGLYFFPGAWLLWCLLGGLTQGGCLALGLSLIALRATSGDAARRLSAMVQSVGYGIAAAGPVVIGALAGATGGWGIPVHVLIALSVACGLTGVRAASSRPVT